MKISIITPTYNSEKTLARTIDSIVRQKYPDLEYIICDNNSNDNTREIIKRYSNIINIRFISEPDKGLYNAMNKGINLATGEIIGILNSDDFYHTDKVLSNVVKKFQETTADMVYGDIVYFSDDVNKITRKWSAGEYKEKLLDSGWIIPHPALFVKKEIYHKYGVYNESYKIASDYEFILRMLKINKVKVAYIKETLVRMYNSGTSKNNRALGWQDLKKSWVDNNLKLPRFFLLRRLLQRIKQFLY